MTDDTCPDVYTDGFWVTEHVAAEVTDGAPRAFRVKDVVSGVTYCTPSSPQVDITTKAEHHMQR